MTYVEKFFIVLFLIFVPEFVQIFSRSHLKMRVWERGAGIVIFLPSHLLVISDNWILLLFIL